MENYTVKQRFSPPRVICYILGIFFLSLGTAASVKSMLGSGPVVSIPYAVNLITGISFGTLSFLWQCLMLLLQLIILRKVTIWLLLQLLSGFLFGYFNNVGLWIMGFFPDPTNIFFKLVFIAISSCVAGFGVWLYTQANVINMPNEGAVKALAEVLFKKPFHKVKIGFDVSCVAIGLLLSIIFLHSLGSVGLGTIIISVWLGSMIGVYERHWGEKIRAFLKR